MSIGIQRPVISLSSFSLSQGSYAIFSVPFPASDHFSVMCAIDAATVKRSEVQFHSRWSGTSAPPTLSTPSTSAPSTSARGVTLDAIIAQLQRMDARLDTFSTELYQMNTYVSCIARR